MAMDEFNLKVIGIWRHFRKKKHAWLAVSCDTFVNVAIAGSISINYGFGVAVGTDSGFVVGG